MAKGSDIKLYVAAGLLVVLGGAYYLQTQKKADDKVAHSIEGAASVLPKFELGDDVTAKIDRIVIEKPASEAKDGAEAAGAQKNALVREGETWNLVEPVKYLANQKNVESLIKNLGKLSVKEQIASGKDAYGSYDLTDDKALHVVLSTGDKTNLDLYIGKSGGRGQAVRIAGKDGVYVVDGLSKFLYERDTKGWRDLSILEIDPDKTTKVVVENEVGTFTFVKDGESWKGELQKAKGAKGAIKDFEPSKVGDLVRAFKSVNATGFGDGKTLTDTGLDKPRATVKLVGEGEKETVLFVGSDGESSSRWAKLPEKDQIFSISSWVSDWAVADETKFQKKKEDDKKGESGDDGENSGMPPGMMPPH